MLKRDGAQPQACSPPRMAGPWLHAGHPPAWARKARGHSQRPPACGLASRAMPGRGEDKGARGCPLERAVVRAVQGPGQKNGKFTVMDDGSWEPTA